MEIKSYEDYKKRVSQWRDRILNCYPTIGEFSFDIRIAATQISNYLSGNIVPMPDKFFQIESKIAEKEKEMRLKNERKSV